MTDGEPARRPSTASLNARPKTAGRNAERPPSARQLSQRPPSRLGQPPPTVAGSPVAAVGPRVTTSYEARSARSTVSSFRGGPPPPSAGRRTTAVGGGMRANSSLGVGHAPSRGLTAAAPPSAAAAVGVPPPFKPGTGAHRPVTQQGVSGIRTQSRMGSAMGQRRVADKTYFLGLLNGQLKSLQDEIDSLRHEQEVSEKERRNLLVYEQRAEEQASEIKELQAELAKLNLVIDRQNTGADVRELELELAAKERECANISASLETLFAERRVKEMLAQQLQDRIRQTREKNAQRISNLDPSLKSTMERLQKEQDRLDAELKEKQRELDSLNSVKEELDMALASSPLKQQASLESHIRELEQKKAFVLKELNAGETPEEQKQRLIDRIQKDNEEISHMQLQIQEATERIAQAQEEIREFSNEFDIVASDRSQRYRELRLRDAHYNAFLDAFDDAMEQIDSRIQELSTVVVRHLRLLSANCELAELTTLGQATGMDESVFALSGNKTLNTSELQDLCVRLQEELLTLERAEQRLTKELEAMHEKQTEIDEMQTSLTDLDLLRASGDQQRSDLETKKSELLTALARLDGQIQRTKERTAEMERKMASLGADSQKQNAYMRELKNRVDLAESERDSIRDKVEALRTRNDFQEVKAEVMKLRAEYNALLCSMRTIQHSH